jgi:hypothetical protein
MAYKVFSNGSVLNASDLNDYLMNQSVIVFNSSAARASAITSPVEGMITYLTDTDVYQFWNGSAWTSLVSSPSSGNLLINGAFEINQRAYVSAANLASGSYGFDRWKSSFTNTTLTYTAAPGGQQVTINSGGSIEQIIERENVPAGTYTLSWSGTATGRVYNTGATPPSYAASPITVTLDGLANVEVEFTASGGTRTLSKVQLEPGSSASSFRRNGSNAGEELASCQRYYIRFSAATEYAYIHGFGNAWGTTTQQSHFKPAVTMRAVPSSLDFSASNRLFDENNQIVVTGCTLNSGSTTNDLVANITVASGLTQYRNYTLLSPAGSGGFVGFSAEL